MKEPLVALLTYLKAADYRFVTVTPATHAIVLARPKLGRITLRDIFGWSRWFDPGEADAALVALLRSADSLEMRDGKARSRVRVSSLGEDLLLHGAFPTDAPDSVFFGPDSYRFARFIEQRLPALGSGGWLIDMGAGAGAGAIAAARCGRFDRITLVDVNPAALRLARANGLAAGRDLEISQADVVPSGPDIVIANPPYMIDAAGRAYRDGQGLLGGGLALDWARQALGALASGGTMLLYTGAAFVGGEAPLLGALRALCADEGASIEIEEIDPDVFGEELGREGYGEVERIAAIGALIRR